MDKIVCVGKNYLEHAKELGDVVPERPVIFLKPPGILRSFEGKTLSLKLPVGAGAVHHECEIVLKMGSRNEFTEVTLGLDLTLRDRQAEQKKKGHPWTTSKVFPDSAVVGPWMKVESFPNFLDAEFTFKLNGEVRQRGKGSQMCFSPQKCVAYINEFFPLLPGDLIFTGTPAGVGPLSAGQKGLLTWGSMEFQVAWI